MIDEKTLMNMVLLEKKLRLNPKFLNLVLLENQKLTSSGDKCIDLLQKEILNMFKIKQTKENLFIFRNAELYYPDNDEFKTIPIQKKFNIISNGNLNIGDFIPPMKCIFTRRYTTTDPISSHVDVDVDVDEATAGETSLGTDRNESRANYTLKNEEICLFPNKRVENKPIILITGSVS